MGWCAPEPLPTDASQPAIANAWGGTYTLDHAAMRAERQQMDDEMTEVPAASTPESARAARHKPRAWLLTCIAAAAAAAAAAAWPLNMPQSSKAFPKDAQSMANSP